MKYVQRQIATGLVAGMRCYHPGIWITCDCANEPEARTTYRSTLCLKHKIDIKTRGLLDSWPALTVTLNGHQHLRDWGSSLHTEVILPRSHATVYVERLPGSWPLLGVTFANSVRLCFKPSYNARYCTETIPTTKYALWTTSRGSCHLQHIPVSLQEIHLSVTVH